MKHGLARALVEGRKGRVNDLIHVKKETMPNK
jgi:hypothetical protein